MKNRNRIFGALLLAIGWMLSLAFIKSWLAPATGAATVMQLEASNAAYAATTAFMSAASLAGLIISLVFAALIYLVLRSK